MELCKLNNVSLYCTATADRVRWISIQMMIDPIWQNHRERTGAGETPELAIVDCKSRDFEMKRVSGEVSNG